MTRPNRPTASAVALSAPNMPSAPTTAVRRSVRQLSTASATHPVSHTGPFE
jgi:hypothetical protein